MEAVVGGGLTCEHHETKLGTAPSPRETHGRMAAQSAGPRVWFCLSLWNISIVGSELIWSEVSRGGSCRFTGLHDG